jgi:hypothetical protein
MRDTNRLPSAVFVLVAAFTATPVGAQPPGSPSGPSAAKPPKAAERAELRAAKADDKADKAQHKAEKAGDKNAAKDAAKDEKGALKDADNPGKPPPEAMGSVMGMHKGHRHRVGGYRALAVDFRGGAVSKVELQDRIKKMHEHRSERRKENREGVRRRWGAALLHPACREELRHHARREAFLSRALFLAQTEPVKNKDALIARIEKLIEKEDARHERAMERLKSTPVPPASASGAAPTPALPASAAPSARVPAPAPSLGKAGAQ